MHTPQISQKVPPSSSHYSGAGLLSAHRASCATGATEGEPTAREMLVATVNKDIDEALPRSNVLTRSGSRRCPVT
jgi:hypothetical protein